MMSAQKQIVNDIHVAKEFNVLKRPGNAKARYLVGSSVEHGIAFKKNNSFDRFINPADAVKKRGLPCTIGTNHGVDLPLSNLHVDLLQRDNATKFQG
jgi:hypothetical protein